MPYAQPGAQRPTHRVTIADVEAVAFGKPPFGRRGYDESEVDDFLHSVAAALSPRPGRGAVTAQQVHDVAFRKPRIGSRGYDEDEVDAFLDLVEAELRWRATPEGQRELHGDPTAGGHPGLGGPDPGRQGMGQQGIGQQGIGQQGMAQQDLGRAGLGQQGIGQGPGTYGGPVQAGGRGGNPGGATGMLDPVRGAAPGSMAGAGRPAVRAVAVAVLYDRGRILSTEILDPSTGRTVYRPPSAEIQFGERGHEAALRAFQDDFGVEIADLRALATLESIYRFAGQDDHELVLVYEATPIDPAVWTQPRLIGRRPEGPITAIWVPVDLFRRGEATLLPEGLLALLDALPGA